MNSYKPTNDAWKGMLFKPCTRFLTKCQTFQKVFHTKWNISRMFNFSVKFVVYGSLTTPFLLRYYIHYSYSWWLPPPWTAIAIIHLRMAVSYRVTKYVWIIIIRMKLNYGKDFDHDKSFIIGFYFEEDLKISFLSWRLFINYIIIFRSSRPLCRLVSIRPLPTW